MDRTTERLESALLGLSGLVPGEYVRFKVYQQVGAHRIGTDPEARPVGPSLARLTDAQAVANWLNGCMNYDLLFLGRVGDESERERLRSEAGSSGPYVGRFGVRADLSQADGGE